jgi:hypothetical protein
LRRGFLPQTRPFIALQGSLGSPLVERVFGIRSNMSRRRAKDSPYGDAGMPGELCLVKSVHLEVESTAVLRDRTDDLLLDAFVDVGADFDGHRHCGPINCEQV